MWERDLGGVRVLLVEDDLDCRELFRISQQPSRSGKDRSLTTT